jgi:hypothetical protein
MKVDSRGRSLIAALRHPRSLQTSTLSGPSSLTSISLDHGASRTRTGDLLHAEQTLSQLSYGPAPFSVAANS